MTTSQGYNWVLSRVLTTFNDIIWLTCSIKYDNFTIYEAHIGTVSAIFTEIDWRSQAQCLLFSIALHVLNYDAIRAPLYFFTGILENGLLLSTVTYAQRLRKEWQLEAILSIHLGEGGGVPPFRHNLPSSENEFLINAEHPTSG